ncbi:MAG: alanyl-tRNA editing protein [Lachnospiraceae bacterium]|nr:alanyl-tRNA editing protein [Lachnospiraceae bacterium]
MNKLYENDSYMKECNTVINGADFTENRAYIYIRDSIFFPEEGGQYADTGRIILNAYELDVLDGQITDGGIRYRVDYSDSCKKSFGELPALSDILVINSEIHCVLDYDKRYDRMQNHTGEHILTGTVHNDYGYNNVGFHLSDDGLVTLDLDGPLTYDQIIKEEARANAVIYANLPVRASYPSKDELKDIAYRSKIDIEGQVRLITIGDDKTTVDICACCAPHVAHTGEVGIIKVISIVNWKGGVRIGILCGRRALEYINHRQNIIMGLTDLMTTNEDNLIERVRGQMDEIKDLKAKLSGALEGDIVSRIEKGDTDIDRTHLVFVDPDFPAGPMKNIYNVLKNKYSGYVGIFAGDDTSGYRYLAGSRNIDSTALIPILNKIGAKGGGNPDMIQGRVQSTRLNIESVITEISLL